VVLNQSLTMRQNRQKASRKTVGINEILQFCNLIVACLILSGFFNEELSKNPYVDSLTLVLGLTLCLQNYIALRMEKRNPNPFILLMVFPLTFFYSLRIFTLTLYPVQEVFERFSYGPEDSNYALFYILLANIFVYAGFYRIKTKNTAEVDVADSYPAKPHVLMVIFILSLLFSLFIQQKLPESIEADVNRIYSSLLTPNMVLLVLATYIIIYRKTLSPKYLTFVLVSALILVGIQTLSFSRGGLLTLFDNSLILVLALIPSIRIPRKYVFLGFVLVPVLLPIAFTLFSISTYTRTIKGDMGGSLAEKIWLLQESRSALKDNPRTEFFMGHALARAGSFDFSAEIIAHRAQYAGIFTLRNYAASIADNLLTPGFDIFDQPRISASLKSGYLNFGMASQKAEREAGHSDQIGMYGELYSLFWWFSLLVFYFFAYYLKKIFYSSWQSGPFLIALKRVFTMVIFYRFINSFGLDWIVFDLATIAVAFYSISRVSGLHSSGVRSRLNGTALPCR